MRFKAFGALLVAKFRVGAGRHDAVLAECLRGSLAGHVKEIFRPGSSLSFVALTFRVQRLLAEVLLFLFSLLLGELGAVL